MHTFLATDRLLYRDNQRLFGFEERDIFGTFGKEKKPGFPIIEELSSDTVSNQALLIVL